MLAEFITNQKRIDGLVDNGAILVDLRSPIDFRNGSLTNAVNLPLRNFLNAISGMDKKTKIILYGNKEELETAVNYAARLGFEVYKTNGPS